MRHRQRHLLVPPIDREATDEVVALVVDAPGADFNVLVGVERGKDLHHHAGEEESLALHVVQIRQIHTVLTALDVGGLLHVDEERRGTQNTVPVGVVPFGSVVGGIVHDIAPLYGIVKNTEILDSKTHGVSCILYLRIL